MQLTRPPSKLFVIAALALFLLVSDFWLKSRAASNPDLQRANSVAPDVQPEKNPEPASSGLSAEVMSVNVIPWTTSAGQRVAIALITVRNSGSVPITSIRAEITAYDSAGKRVCSVSDAPIFIAQGSQSPIQPGVIYSTTVEQGGQLLEPRDGVPATTATATIAKLNAR